MSTWVLHTQVDLESANLHLDALEDAGLLGLVECDGRTDAWFPAHRADLPLDGTWEEVADQDWNAAWKADIRPIAVGAVTIVPPWLAGSDDAGITLVIEPAQAFGTGHHETTTGCLAALQEQDLTGCFVLDIGTGTGILAIAAARLGAAQVVAVDIDPLAVEAAAANAVRNEAAVDVRTGSAEAAEGVYDVVLANLDSATLRVVAAELAARLAPRGTFIGSGIAIERAAEAVDVLAAVGLVATASPGQEWVVLRGHH